MGPPMWPWRCGLTARPVSGVETYYTYKQCPKITRCHRNQPMVNSHPATARLMQLKLCLMFLL